MKKTKNKKIFECKGGCTDMFAESVNFGCSKCIKKFCLTLSEEQKQLITSIIKIYKKK